MNFMNGENNIYEAYESLQKKEFEQRKIIKERLLSDEELKLCFNAFNYFLSINLSKEEKALKNKIEKILK